MTQPEPVLLHVDRVTKSFSGVAALSEVEFTVDSGQCLALVGENGAGKSTLMKILSGVWPYGTYQGDVFFDGKPLKLSSTPDGRRSGISIIHQELCLFPKLTTAENLFITEAFPYDGTPSSQLFGRVRWKQLIEKAEALFEELGFAVGPQTRVEDLSVAQCQLVEIARAFHHRARLLILDEPTSALSQKEVGHLFEVIGRMRKASMAFIYISHKLDEVFALADKIVVLRDGRSVKELSPANTSEAEVIHHMVGRPVEISKKHCTKAERQPVLKVDRLTHLDRSNRATLREISFDLRRGEILGIAGLMGSGRSELLRSILGILPGKRSGNISYLGQAVAWNTISEAIRSGVAFVPEDRKKDGLFLGHPIHFNLTICILNTLLKVRTVLSIAREKTKAKALASQMNVKCASTRLPVRALSGGNQQKVLLARVVALAPTVLILDEPTRGIDVGAKEEIYNMIRQLASKDMSILLVSSELPEILNLSDRVLVLRHGCVTALLDNYDLSAEQVMAFAAGNGDTHASFGTT